MHARRADAAASSGTPGHDEPPSTRTLHACTLMGFQGKVPRSCPSHGVWAGAGAWGGQVEPPEEHDEAVQLGAQRPAEGEGGQHDREQQHDRGRAHQGGAGALLAVKQRRHGLLHGEEHAACAAAEEVGPVCLPQLLFVMCVVVQQLAPVRSSGAPSVVVQWWCVALNSGLVERLLPGGALCLPRGLLRAQWWMFDPLLMSMLPNPLPLLQLTVFSSYSPSNPAKTACNTMLQSWWPCVSLPQIVYATALL